MLCLKVLCSLLLLSLTLAAPPKQENNNLNVKKRVERNRRQILTKSEEKKLDIENFAPLKIVEASLEKDDNEGDGKINGSKVIDDKNIQYFHEKNKGTVKTIVEEKKDNKMENVFYHLSYEKQEETTQDTTDQTMLDDDEEEKDTLQPDEVTMSTVNVPGPNGGVDDDDLTIPSNENIDNENEEAAKFVPDNQVNLGEANADNSNRNGWFNNWFNWFSGNQVQSKEPREQIQVRTYNDDNSLQNNDQTAGENYNYYDVFNKSNPVQTPYLDNAIINHGGPQFSFLGFPPFLYTSVGLQSPQCPPSRPTLVTVYFVSFCVPSL